MVTRILLPLLALLAACEPEKAEAPTLESCALGSSTPDAPVIDPDAPVYEDDAWTQAEVEVAFAGAAAEDSPAYRAYKAALAHPEYLECAYCACGCAHSDGHLSAIDCFKDMHGFT